jgi:hypothetical protein
MRTAVVLLAVVAGLALAGAANAGTCAVCDQYQEYIPTAGGGSGHHNGGGGGGQSGSQGGSGLSESTQQHLQSSVSAPVASALEQVATSSSLGAPQQTRQKHAGDKKAGHTAMTSKESSPSEVVPTDKVSGSPLSDAVSAAANGGDGHLLAIVLVLAAITAGGAATAFARHRSSGA